jgi:uncharacterized membrane protein YgcG
MMRQGKVMRSWWQVTSGALGLAIVVAALSCSDVLGLDGLSVGSPSEADPCDTCTQASCSDVLAACGDDRPAGCKAFYDCIVPCEDDTCAVGCFVAHPEGQVVIDCICARCSSECSSYCVGGPGGSGGTSQTGGSGGASSSGGSGGGGQAGGRGGSGGASQAGGAGGS